MPIKLPKNIPAYKELKEKGVFIMNEDRAKTQEIRPLRIGIFNLMPTKEVTETQLFRMIGSSPLQIEPVLIRTSSYTPKNTSAQHLDDFYTTFDEVKKEGLDGLIITGAPVETLPFEKVAYWEELVELMNWADKHVSSTLFLCWGAQAGLYNFYGIPKHDLKEKTFGIFPHNHTQCQKLLRGLDDEFFVPHSRHTEIRKEDIEKHSELDILAESKSAGIYMVANKSRSQVFATGHPEYDRETLAKEYFRDKNRGLDIQVPENYFPNNDDTQTPILSWRANAEMFYRNWVNLVYQETPYDLKESL